MQIVQLGMAVEIVLKRSLLPSRQNLPFDFHLFGIDELIAGCMAKIRSG